MIRRLLQLTIRLAPRGFRERNGADLLETCRRRVDERASAAARLWFGLIEVVGLLGMVVRLRFGGGAARADDTRMTTGGGAMFAGIAQDIRFAVRTLRRSPAFTLTAIAVIALGIGANTAIFSAANAFFLRPLPFQAPGRLVMLFETNPEFGWTDAQDAPANLLDWREQVDAFQDVAAWQDFVGQATFVQNDQPTLLKYATVTGNFFSVLGVRPEVGNGFSWDQTWSPDDSVTVLSHGLWASEFGSDPGVVGRTIQFGSTRLKVVGVMPAGFDFPNDGTQFWTTMGWDKANRQATWFRRAHLVRGVARIKPGFTLREADARFQVVVDRLQKDFPDTNSVMGAGMMPLRSFLVKDIRAPLLILLGAVGLLLLLACTNVANLMFVRASGRAREVGVRLALGAGRARVARQILTESLILSLGGGAIGLGVGWIGVEALTAQQRIGVPGATSLALDARVVLFTLAVTVLSALLFGTAPALRAATGGVQEALREGGRTGSTGRGALNTVGGLVVVEVALALMLVVGAGLMIRSSWLLRGIDPGFRMDQVLAVRFSVPPSRYPDRDQVLAFQDDFERRLKGRPGIENVGRVAQLPLNGASWSSQLQVEGWPPDKVGFEILHRRADPGYFEALQIPLLKGRMFNADDEPGTPATVLVNETFARKYFPDEDPIGRRITYDRLATAQSVWHTIVGVVGDQRQVAPGKSARPEVFENSRQDWDRSGWVVVRTTGDPMAALSTVKSVLKEMDPLIPLGTVRTMREVWRQSMAHEQFVLTLLGTFGALALLLATVGVYGVTAQAARRRTHEIGIRMALGAEARAVMVMMLRRGLTLVGVGLVLGLGGALLATRVLRALLYGIAPTDPVTLAAVVVMLAVAATAACWVPARRATGVDPANTLRTE
jgi:predicted permease